MSSEVLFELLVRLLAVSMTIQSFEFVSLRGRFQPGGLFYEGYTHTFLRFLGKQTLAFEFSRILICFYVFLFPKNFEVGILICGLLVLTFLTHLRTLGRFNGGSDSITWITLLGITLGFVNWDFQNQKPDFELSLVFVGVFSLISYFQAGLSKLISGQWFNGSFFIEGKNLGQVYGKRAETLFGFCAQKSAKNKWFSVWLGLGVLGFELSSVGVLFSAPFSVIFVVGALFFHLGVFYFFGLNRFFWSWLATFPGLLFVGFLEPGLSLLK
jgi:hypothetical protein